ncbi:ras GTPase-activating-like protein IQGAP3 [Tachyglossus aculeatus]|uniref:ras GTPase-activating-like protein IQGAP3 n=1 Tax=Tachyglossus aculeatus TaxID=9261 RepID=UPI0018F60F22|nr:ras GTPase-activating-like protein IQGAP3 [Tachyglossus aculeatus]
MDGGAACAAERPTADEMDAQRRETVVYQYLCRLEEAKRWLESCLGERLPPALELERSLRNGVVLARLGSLLAPDAAPPARIYDADQTRYKASGLHFRHTDNINFWRGAMETLGLPSIFYPETTDVYDGKNLPRVVYCLHALSLYLFHLGLAPQILDLDGQLRFTREELSSVRSELDRQGLQLPAFGGIADLLAGETTGQQAVSVTHGHTVWGLPAQRRPPRLRRGSSPAALRAAGRVNAAVRRGRPEETLRELRSPAARLPPVVPSAAPLYQRELRALQRRRPGEELGPEELFVAVEMLSAVALVNAALDAGDAGAVGDSLGAAAAAGLAEVRGENAQRYFEALLRLKESRGAGGFLCWNELQDCVGRVNMQARAEAEGQAAAVSIINAALRRDDPAETLRALLLPPARLHPVIRSDAAARYHYLLAAAQAGKPGLHPPPSRRYSSRSGPAPFPQAAGADAALTLDEIGQVVARANEDTEAAHGGEFEGHLPSSESESCFPPMSVSHFCPRFLTVHVGSVSSPPPVSLRVPRASEVLAVAAIERAVRAGGPEPALLRALGCPAVGLRGVQAAGAAGYQQRLTALLTGKRTPGRESPWVQHRLRDGSAFYLQLRTLEGSWAPPPAPAPVPPPAPLTRREIQGAVSAVAEGLGRRRLWAAQEELVVRLQARLRGCLVRRTFAARLRQLRARRWDAAVRIQSCWRGYRQRRAFGERLVFLRKNAAAVIRIQAWVRRWRVQRRYRERQRHFQKNVAAVVKIQARVRAWKAQSDYHLLLRAPHPPLRVVRRFAGRLSRGREERAELGRLQAELSRRVRANRALERDLDLLDVQIGLLVRSRATLQEVASQCRRLTRGNRERLAALLGPGRPEGLKSLTREKRHQLEAYQHLFYLLQTHPTYLARLIAQMPPTRASRLLEPVVFSLFNYACGRRDAYLLLQLFRAALQEEIRARVDRPRDIVTGNPPVIRLVVSFYRRGPGTGALRAILEGPVRDVLRDPAPAVRTDPVDVYKAWVNRTEAQTGKKSALPYDVGPDEALSHPEVRQQLDAAICSLVASASRFSAAITASADGIPYGMRYVAKVLRTSLAEKFPDAEAEIWKVVSHVLYYRFLNPAVVAPDAFDVVDLVAGGALTLDQRRHLGAVAQLLQRAASGQTWPGPSCSHLQPLNDFLTEGHHQFRKLVGRVCRVQEPEARFGVDEYAELVSVARPVVYLTAGELVNIHKLLLAHRDSVAPDPRDPLRGLLEDLGEVPSITALLGVAEETDGGQLDQLEISLTLTAKPADAVAAAAAEADTDQAAAGSLLLSAKQMLADVIEFQAGDTVPEVLALPPSQAQEDAHHRLQLRRREQELRTPGPRGRDLRPPLLTLQEKKRRLARDLRRLEGLGVLAPAEGYQGIVDEMAKDIRQQHGARQRVRMELAKLRAALRALEAKAAFHEEQLDYYGQYLRTCLGGLAASGGDRCPGKGKAPSPVRYTAMRLLDKGVLLGIEGLPPQQLRNVIFDIAPGVRAGQFEVSARFMGVEMEQFQLNYQDLLQLQYEGVAVMKLFHRATVNVNLLLFLLDRKFCKK